MKLHTEGYSLGEHLSKEKKKPEVIKEAKETPPRQQSEKEPETPQSKEEKK